MLLPIIYEMKYCHLIDCELGLTMTAVTRSAVENAWEAPAGYEKPVTGAISGTLIGYGVSALTWGPRSTRTAGATLSFAICGMAYGRGVDYVLVKRREAAITRLRQQELQAEEKMQKE